MGTQAVVSVMLDGKMVAKIVTGSSGYNAKSVADRIRESRETDLGALYRIAFAGGFDDERSLVVVGPDRTSFHKTDDDLPELYHSTFHHPRFNPGWECGLASHTQVVRLLSPKACKICGHTAPCIVNRCPECGGPARRARIGRTRKQPPFGCLTR